jgi:hypothetical protein
MEATANSIFLAALSSTVISAVISAIILGIFNLRTKRSEYVNEYHKLILQRRITAYEHIETLIFLIKTAVIDTDGDHHPYHHVFAQENPQQILHGLLGNIMIHSLWLSKEAFESTRKLNILLFSLLDNGLGAVEFGKTHYQQIVYIREELEDILAEDMRTLHQVDRFLKSKKTGHSDFQIVKLERPKSQNHSPPPTA